MFIIVHAESAIGSTLASGETCDSAAPSYTSDRYHTVADAFRGLPKDCVVVRCEALHGQVDSRGAPMWRLHAVTRPLDGGK